MLDESTALRDYLEEVTAYYRRLLTENGFDIIQGTHPIVPKAKARIRTQVCASHTKEDVDFIVKCFKEVREEMGQ